MVNKTKLSLHQNILKFTLELNIILKQWNIVFENLKPIQWYWEYGGGKKDTNSLSKFQRIYVKC